LEEYSDENPGSMTLIVDAHADIAWNIISFDRDYTRPVSETRAAEVGSYTVQRNGTSMLGWPEWVSGRVAVIFASLYVTPKRWQTYTRDTVVYSDFDEAKRQYWAQMDGYSRLVEEAQDKFGLILTVSDLEDILKTWNDGVDASPRVGLVISMEGAEGILDVGELERWYQRGLRILGPCWAGTRYAGGTHEPGPLTDEGRDLLAGMAELGLILDISHMAEQATFEALDCYQGVVIATHSNARALLHGSEFPDRHLSDLVIRRIAERGGVIGVVPYNRFLSGEWREGDPRELVSMDRVLDQIDHMCQIVGSAEHVAIGSDFDGGFGLEKVPMGIDTVADLQLIGGELGIRGYDQNDITAILGGNWLRLLRHSLPES
jgi:membrane dipeptidase